MKYKNLTLNVEGFSDLTKDFQALIDLIPSIPELDKLIVEATKNGPITVDFVSLAELDTTGVYKEKGNQEFLNGRVVKQTIKRKIKVAEEGKSFKDILDTLIFELCNAKNPYFQMYSPESVSPEKYEDREAYATATEYAEYLCTHLPAKEITKAVFSNQKYLEA